MNRKNETAAQAYTRNYTKVRELIAKIDQQVADHSDKQSRNQSDWRYVGDLGHIAELLEQVSESL